MWRIRQGHRGSPDDRNFQGITMKKVEQIAAVDLSGCRTVADMAAREGGWDPTTYALNLSHAVRDSRVPFDTQRERLQALAHIGGQVGDATAAEEISHHYTLLNALWQRFCRLAAMDGSGHGSAASERYLNAALKAQRAALACLSALKAIRDSNQPPTTVTAATLPAPAAK